MCADATFLPARRLRWIDASIAAQVDPHPRTSTSASASPLISVGGMSAAIAAILSARRWTMRSWFSGV